jgi:transcription elongation factor Elf1
MGSIGCRVCGHNYSSQTNHLTEAADLYCEWIDACERANEEEASKMLSTKKSTLKNSRVKSAKSELTT